MLLQIGMPQSSSFPVTTYLCIDQLRSSTLLVINQTYSFDFPIPTDYNIIEYAGGPNSISFDELSTYELECTLSLPSPNLIVINFVTQKKFGSLVSFFILVITDEAKPFM
eukprot:GHVR01185156.1.p1 GENE.GHVR01185156.1~~GHVR01185156.1.p1  ORF type:complete len:110 (+),score=0.21 GHVR01185156.1:213-542(+)